MNKLRNWFQTDKPFQFILGLISFVLIWTLTYAMFERADRFREMNQPPSPPLTDDGPET